MPSCCRPACMSVASNSRGPWLLQATMPLTLCFVLKSVLQKFLEVMYVLKIESDAFQPQFLACWGHLCSVECFVFGTNRTKFERRKAFKNVSPFLQVTDLKIQKTGHKVYTHPFLLYAWTTHYSEMYFYWVYFSKILICFGGLFFCYHMILFLWQTLFMLLLSSNKWVIFWRCSSSLH